MARCRQLVSILLLETSRLYTAQLHYISFYVVLSVPYIYFRYYENNFHVLNFGFYFFLISGFALWADGFKNIPIFDLIFGGILAAATVLYPYGNAYQVVRISQNTDTVFSLTLLTHYSIL